MGEQRENRESQGGQAEEKGEAEDGSCSLPSVTFAMTGRPPSREESCLVELSARLKLSVDPPHEPYPVSTSSSSSSAYIAAISVFGAERKGHLLSQGLTIQHSDGPPLINRTMTQSGQAARKPTSDVRNQGLEKSSIHLPVRGSIWITRSRGYSADVTVNERQ